MLLTHFIWQTDLKPLSGTNAKNGAITPSLTPTMQARCYNAGKWVRTTWRGITNSSRHLGALLVLYLGVPWTPLLGESFHVNLRLMYWGGARKWQVLGNRSMRIQDLYVGTFPRFIRNISICCWPLNVHFCVQPQTQRGFRPFTRGGDD